jgi:hypothetical protein
MRYQNDKLGGTRKEEAVAHIRVLSEHYAGCNEEHLNFKIRGACTEHRRQDYHI